MKILRFNDDRVGVIKNGDMVVDVSDTIRSRKAKGGQRVMEEIIEGAPDLVIEILSATTSRSDRVTKAQIYARHKVPAYWIVDPELETVEIYLLNVDSYRLTATLQGETPLPAPPFADLKFAARDLFI